MDSAPARAVASYGPTVTFTYAFVQQHWLLKLPLRICARRT